MQGLESLHSIFKDRIFRVPDYQRGYAWTVKKQLTDFWDDVVNLSSDKEHYTGLLSLKKLELDKSAGNTWKDERWLIDERGHKLFHVVDGQQRLTTFIIFIQAISELLKDKNPEKEEEDIYLGSFSLKYIKESYLVVEKPPEFFIKTYKFGYEVDNPSFKFLKHKIFNEKDGGTLSETFYTLNLENAKKFFKENIDDFYNQYGHKGIEVLFKKITQKLMFNVYEISDNFDVFVAFETMNNRGKKLSNLELLKNRLIYLTTLYKEDELKSDDRTSLRDKINDAWKEVYYQLGRNKQSPLNDDVFLKSHWIMYFPYTRAKGDDYINFLLERKFTPKNIYKKTEVKLNSIEEFNEIEEDEEADQDYIESDENNEEKTTHLSELKPKDIENYVNSLKSAAGHWYNTYNPINNPDLSEKESLWIERLNRVGMAYFRPLITASYLSNKFTLENREQLLQAIERFIFIAFQLGQSQSNFGSSEFYNSARQLRKDEISIINITISLRMKMERYFYLELGKEYLDYSKFQNSIEDKFKDKNGGGFYNWNGLRYFLYEYEMEKVRQRGNEKIYWKLFVKNEKDKVSIEHIYPQTPKDICWKDAFNGRTKQEKLYCQGTLGNLLPLSQSINASLQNDCFVDKRQPKYNERQGKIRQGYSNGSHSEIEVSQYSDWNPDTILERGINLLKFMEERWDLKFENEQSMKELLFMEFVDKSEETE